MTEVQRVRDQMERALRGDAWHGPALLEVLRPVGAATARLRPVPDAHTIWEIVLHLTNSVELVLSRLAGEARQLTREEDWPSQPTAGDDNAWRAAVAALEQAHERLLAALDTLDPLRLDDPIVPGFSTVYHQLHGTVQHDLYHAGQIALLVRVQEGDRHGP